MFRKPENVFRSYIVQYVLVTILELVVVYNIITPHFITNYEDLYASIIMITVFFFIIKAVSFMFIQIFFQFMIYEQLKNMKESFSQHKKTMTFLYLISVIVPIIALLKNSVHFQSLAFLASFYLLYVSIVVGFNSLLLIRMIVYNEENDMLSHAGWLTFFFLGIISVDIPMLLKVCVMTIIMTVMFVFSLFLLQNHLTLPLKRQKRLAAGTIWQISVNFRKKNIFQNMLTFHNIVAKGQMDTRCDFFQNSQVLLSNSLKDISEDDFRQLCENNYYMIIDVPLYERFVVGSESQFPNVIIVAIKVDEFVDGRELVPEQFEIIASDFYRKTLPTIAGLEKLMSKKKKTRRINNATQNTK